ncbi:serologically defined colon cancer antigen 3 -like protein [Chelydra serpentina]|uniref:Endosome-associated-trafficking regulator 1 n=1 Tax=Chelydra serpentina TaxID=8475 RepID=A0A8T1S835_CHESE|nr:serologically defined colon cancer antigen 3 -like protein [Chelydra serpentina]
MPRPLFPSGTLERACPQSQGLDNEEEEPICCYPHHPPPPPDHVKSLISPGDNHLEDPEGVIPFSLKGFVKTKTRGMAKEEELKNRMFAKKLVRHNLGLEDDSLTPEPFYKDLEMSDILSDDEDDDWGGSYHHPALEKARKSRFASMSPCSPHDSLYHNTARQLGIEAFGPCLHPRDLYLSRTAHDKAPESCALHEESIGDREYPSLQLSYEELKEENSMLRRKIKSIQSFSESQTRVVRNLERRLRASVVKEEKEAQGLESIVQQAERNLQGMTQRALKAESKAAKLKQEMSLLQVELESFKAENDMLRAGQSDSLGAVQQNVDVALQNLCRVIANAHLSIKQLVSGTEMLHFVADLLKSIDKISEVKKEDDG